MDSVDEPRIQANEIKREESMIDDISQQERDVPPEIPEVLIEGTNSGT